MVWDKIMGQVACINDLIVVEWSKGWPKAHFDPILDHLSVIFLLWNFNDEWNDWIIFGWLWGGQGWIVVDFASCKASCKASSTTSSTASLLVLTSNHFEQIGFMCINNEWGIEWEQWCYCDYLPLLWSMINICFWVDSFCGFL